MNLQELKQVFVDHPDRIKISDQLNLIGSKVHLKGLIGSAASLIPSGVIENSSVPHLFVLNDKEEAAYFLNDLQSIFPSGYRILFFPETHRLPYQLEKTDNSNIQLRAEALTQLNKRVSKTIIITYPAALREKVVTKKNLRSHTFDLEVGKEYDLEKLNEKLFDHEFERVDYVFEPGQFSIRGGIIDIFSFANDHPYRVEFFGDEVDSIRTFNPVDQLSIAQIQNFSVVPNIRKRMLSEGRANFLEFIGEESVIWIKDYQLLLDQVEKEYEKAEKIFNEMENVIEQIPPHELFVAKKDLRNSLENYSVIEFGYQFFFKPDLEIKYNLAPQPSFNKRFDLLIKNLEDNTIAKFTNVIVSGQAKQIERLYTIFEDLDAKVKFSPIATNLHQGFIDKTSKVAVYTDHQIFERYHRFHLKEGYAKNKQALTLKEIHNLQKGDFVTHIDHGVGKFSGLEKIDVNGKLQEAIRLVYKDNDVLYVSIHSLHRISKFSGKEGTQPSVNKLGSPKWANLKQKTKIKIKEIAYDLIKLYAQRKSQIGFQFTPDTYLQTELEASFMYEDTPDQFKATQDVKKDMEAEAPMDRLICGDVGFGKTEVAIRAAFKAVADSKQVAILVPTTILSIQHFKNFKERLKEFPVTVDYINRFKSKKKQTETLKNLAEGKIDIIVGTHRIVGKDIKFKDLGLMIIDEEQKFGVAVKDKLKLFKSNVDTLTLTATPIPRTLQFSLMGARDLSIINTPPPNRQPVHTEVCPFNEEVIRDAISEEINRGGQIFFIHNKIQNIQEVAGMIQRLCPGVKTGIVHGRLDGDKLERVMMDFIDGEYDILLATTIIESGIDIPNANTMIINDAQNFGLSDLHQLRGRIGRSNKKAFCYLLAPPMHLLPNESRQRLEAISQFSDLGSGFSIAMRDLDIRGAGNLLGGEQSGFINDIGMDMYQKILRESIEELREKEFADLFQDHNKNKDFVEDCQMETDFNLIIPDDYVNNVAERLALYKELDESESEEDLHEFENRLTDRFGPIPEQTKELMDAVRLRWMAKEIGFEKIILKNGKLIGYFITKKDSPYYQSPLFTRVLKYIQTNPSGCKMNEKNNKLRLIYGNINNISKGISRLSEVLMKRD